jgi:hypothetical protein
MLTRYFVNNRYQVTGIMAQIATHTLTPTVRIISARLGIRWALLAVGLLKGGNR